MDSETVKNRIQNEIIREQFPEMSNIVPQVEFGPAERQLSTLRRSRDIITETDINSIPKEYKLTYRLRRSEQFPFNKTVIVTTNEQGEPQLIIESK
ncbi:hypothetical protein AB0756_40020 [Tolypothrix campylonemoides VB511288_2]|uniref:Uncharacterized protein n=2 Tax=Tolypothrix TaxID=111782 RepID=A0A0C1RP28_9CYAN